MVLLVTDGGSNLKEKTSGWGYAIVIDGNIVKEEYGVVPNCTNQQMEIEAVIRGLVVINSLYPEAHVTVKTDSKYAIGLLTYANDGWMFKAKANKELVAIARTIIKECKQGVTFQWVKGHSGECPFHDRVDKQLSRVYNGGGHAVRNKRTPIKVKKKSVKGKYK